MRQHSLPLFLAITLGMTACGTPQDQCISRNTRDLRIVDRLVTETQGNLARGYALEQVTVTNPVWRQCERIEVDAKGKKKPRPPRLCLEDETETVTRPKAIDLVTEQRKLDSLVGKRAALQKSAGQVIAACRARYPE